MVEQHYGEILSLPSFCFVLVFWVGLLPGGVDSIACKWEVLLSSFQLFFHLSQSSTLHLDKAQF